MRISELAQRGGVPVGTVKFYLREGLLPPGERTSATQARYGEQHVERLVLVRTLVGVGGLSIAAARRVVAALDGAAESRRPPSLWRLIGAAHDALGGWADASPDALRRARELVRRHGWRVHPDTSALGALAAALDGLDAAGLGEDVELQDRYAAAAAGIAAGDVAGVPTDSPEAAIRYVVTGTVLLEPLLLALRRLAQQDATRRRFTAAP